MIYMNLKKQNTLLLKKFLILILLFEANLQLIQQYQTLIKLSGTVIGYSAIVKRKYTYYEN
jgi:hypothetical protein